MRSRNGAAPGAFDFYVLALSWSASFCEIAGDQRGSRQCDAGRGLDFVVHGLWPQFARGYPVYCGAADRPIPRDALEDARGVFPEDGLARHEWKKHGTCSGLSPAEYFRAAGRARAAVTIPPALRRVENTQRIDPDEIEKAFLAVNPGLRPEAIAVSCARGRLEEVRICLARDLRGFQPCPEVDRAACRVSSVAVPPVR